MWTMAALACGAQVTGPRAADTFAPGVSAGIAYTPDDDLAGIGWHAAGTLEHPLGTFWELRGTLGVAGFQGESKAEYAFLIADVLGSDLISPTGGLGVYYLEEDDESTFQAGLNGGVRLFLPYSNHEDHAITVDARVHALFGEGPSLLFTLGAGVVF